MDLISALSALETPVTQLLPHGAIRRLAKKHGYHHDTVSRMLRGTEEYDVENVKVILLSALEEIKADAKSKLMQVKQLEKSFRHFIAA